MKIAHILSQIDAASPTGATIVAQDEEQLVAALTVSFDQAQGHGFVRSLFVREECRGQGIGPQLLHEAERLCRQQGFEQLRLSVKDTNYGARKLYDSLGFKPYAPAGPGYTQCFKQLLPGRG